MNWSLSPNGAGGAVGTSGYSRWAEIPSTSVINTLGPFNSVCREWFAGFKGGQNLRTLLKVFI